MPAIPAEASAGYSPSFGDLLTVMSFIDDNGVEQGTTAFCAEGKDRRYYNEE